MQSLSDISHPSYSVRDARALEEDNSSVVSEIILQWGYCVNPRWVVLPRLLIQQQDIFLYLSWLPAAVSYQLNSTTKYPLLQEFQQSLVAVSLFHSTLHSAPSRLYCVWGCWLCSAQGVATILPPIFSILLSLILPQAFFSQSHFWQLSPLRAKTVVNSFASKKGRDTC